MAVSNNDLRQKLRLAAMNMLARREQSRKELEQKLYERYIAAPKRDARKRAASKGRDTSRAGRNTGKPSADCHQPFDSAASATFDRSDVNVCGLAQEQSRNILERVEDHLAQQGADTVDSAELLAPEAVLAEVLDRLQMQGLQDDARFAESFVRARFNRGDGPQKVRSALRTKGIENETIQDLLNDEQFDWFASAAEVLQRKFDRSALLAAQKDMKLRAKQQRFLAGRGFSGDHVREAMSALLSDEYADQPGDEFEPDW